MQCETGVLLGQLQNRQEAGLVFACGRQVSMETVDELKGQKFKSSLAIIREVK